MKTHILSLEVSTSDRFDVRQFEVTEGLHELFRAEIIAVCGDPEVDFDAIMGQVARFSLQRTEQMPVRFWQGVVTCIERIGVEPDGLSTYRLVIQPRLWLLTQTRNYRIFQQLSDPDIALEVLSKWGLKPRRAFEASQFKGRKYRVQYAESDYRFMRRVLEDAGITFHFEERGGNTELVLIDGPQSSAPRSVPVHYENEPSGELLEEVATNVRVVRRLRPGRYTQRDVDYRRPADFPLLASTADGTAVETGLERFHQNYGAFLYSAEGDGSTPVADDHGAARTDLGIAGRQVDRRLAAKRHNARRCVFDTTCHDLAPGVVFSFEGFPARDLADDVQMLVVCGTINGNNEGEWHHEVDAAFAAQPYHPPLATPKPRTRGVESATVVGAEDDEIHTDEFARVRVQFHWDREGSRDEHSSCWIPVSQPWGGASFGALNIPRVGQEVLIDFLGADPDRPVVVGRVFTKTQPVPYDLPKFKTVSGIRSQSSMRMVTGGAGPLDVVSPLTMPGEGGTAMGMDRLQKALDGEFAALSPNTETHRWNGSEVTFDDQFGREVFYMQAERNLNMVVKNDMTAVIGNARATKIGTNDLLDIDNDHTIRVKNNRCVEVEGSQTHQVTGEIVQQSLEANQTFDTHEAFQSRAKHHLLVSEESCTLQVGDSILYMKPDFVILQTPYLFLNPGEEAVTQAIESGERPMTPEEAAEAAREAQIQSIMSDIDTAFENGEFRDLYGLYHYGDYRYDGMPLDEAKMRWDDLHRPDGFTQPEWGYAPSDHYTYPQPTPPAP